MIKPFLLCSELKNVKDAILEKMTLYYRLARLLSK